MRQRLTFHEDESGTCVAISVELVPMADDVINDCRLALAAAENGQWRAVEDFAGRAVTGAIREATR
jgi:hypothetical protein